MQDNAVDTEQPPKFGPGVTVGGINLDSYKKLSPRFVCGGKYGALTKLASRNYVADN